MIDIQDFRERLISQKPCWTALAKQSGITRRTIERLAADADRSLRVDTYNALIAVLPRRKRAAKVA